MRIIIDASRNRSGGARAHLINVLNASDPREYGFDCVTVYSYQELIDSLPNKSWLVKKSPTSLGRGLISQLLWQLLILPFVCWKEKAVLLTTDGASVNFFSKQVRMVRDLLSFEPVGIESELELRKRLRLRSLKLIHTVGCSLAKGVIFQTKYAARIVEHSCWRRLQYSVIPHGVEQTFFGLKDISSFYLDKRVLNIVYVSPFWPFKNHLTVIDAVAMLKKDGIECNCVFVGGGYHWLIEKCRKRIEELGIRDSIKFTGQVNTEKLKDILRGQDVFVFASSCESYGITLVEGMASGLPIVCSNQSSLSETLGDGGLYFDPKSSDSLYNQIIKLIDNPRLRAEMTNISLGRARTLDWSGIGNDTWSFCRNIFLDS